MTDRIRFLMQQMGMSPSQFADEVGLNRASLSHILSGRNKPSIDIVLKIKERFGEVNLDWLLLGNGNYKDTPSPVEEDVIQEPSKGAPPVGDQIRFSFQEEVVEKASQDAGLFVPDETFRPVPEVEKTKMETNIQEDGRVRTEDSLPAMNSGDEPDHIILLYGDGSYERYQKRKKKRG